MGDGGYAGDVEREDEDGVEEREGYGCGVYGGHGVSGVGEGDVEEGEEGDYGEEEREDEEERKKMEMEIVGGDYSACLGEEVAAVYGFGWERHG